MVHSTIRVPNHLDRLAIFVPDAWRAPVILTGATIEFLETSISIWISRRARAKVGPEALDRLVGPCCRGLRPDGHVRVRGETWRAQCDEGAVVGEQVEIVERMGLTLIVSTATDASSTAGRFERDPSLPSHRGPGGDVR